MTDCSVDGCKKPLFVKGMCQMHYTRVRRYGTTDLPTPRPHPNKTHGLTKTSEHNAWMGMRRRCSNPKDKRYEHYGGRGIKVCDRWQSFEAFIEDMGPKPSPKHSLDRIDNEGDYTPENCRWATHTEQMNNQRRTIMVTIGSRTQSLRNWCRELDIVSIRTARGRVERGWPADQAVLLPVDPIHEPDKLAVLAKYGKEI